MTARVDSRTDLRTLTTTQLQNEGVRLESLAGALEAQLQDIRRNLAAVRVEADRRLRPSPTPRVSDHAVIQYLDRVLGYDIDALRESLLTDAVKRAMRVGASMVPIEGARLKLDNNTVVTVLVDSTQKPKRLRGDRPGRQSERDAIREGMEEDDAPCGDPYAVEDAP